MPRLFYKFKNSETKGRNGKFNFDVALSLKDPYKTFSLKEEFQTINLHSKIVMEKYKKKYRYIRFGVPQAANQPFTTSVLDCLILMAFRDNKLIRHKDSLFAMSRTNICDGRMYCDWSPNYSIDLNDSWIMDTLWLDIQLPNIQNNLMFQFRHLLRNFAFTYRMHFKLLSSQLNPTCILKPSLDETMLLKSESDNVTAFTAKLLKENEITVSQEFITQNTRPPRNIAQNNVQQIIEEPNDRVLIWLNSSQEKVHLQEFLKMSNLLDLQIPGAQSPLIMIL